MNQSAWEALVRHYGRVSMKFDTSKKDTVFRQNLESVIATIPAGDREVILNHWRDTKEAIHPFKGTRHPSPLFILDTNFTSGEVVYRASAMMASNGCAFVFEVRLVYTAPGEVVQGLIAHELAHAWIFAKYHAQNLLLPELSGSSATILEEYQIDDRPEELLVDEIVRRWGYNQHLLELWEIAVEDYPKDPSGYYERLKHSLRIKHSGGKQ